MSTARMMDTKCFTGFTSATLPAVLGEIGNPHAGDAEVGRVTSLWWVACPLITSCGSR